MKDCNQCGKCCIKYGDGDLSATQEEIDLWEIFNPDKKSLNEADKYTCSIYLDRPEDCRHYPSLISEMVRDGCEMIEITDLQQPKKAQVRLDFLMQDSRPPSFS